MLPALVNTSKKIWTHVAVQFQACVRHSKRLKEKSDCRCYWFPILPKNLHQFLVWNQHKFTNFILIMLNVLWKQALAKFPRPARKRSIWWKKKKKTLEKFLGSYKLFILVFFTFLFLYFHIFILYLLISVCFYIKLLYFLF